MSDSTKAPKPPTVVGWHERVALPDLDIGGLYAKLDTGADSSSLHATNITVLGGGTSVEFTPPLVRNQDSCDEWPLGGVRRVRAPIVDERIIRSSNGEEETRPVILTRIRLAGCEFEARFSLTVRTGMRFALLVGRDALAGRFLVDPGQSHVGEPGFQGPCPH